MPSVQEYLNANHERILAELIEFARIPSVSTQPEHRGDIGAAAGWVAAQLTAAGISNVQIIPTSGHPVVYADWLNAPDAPTILIYGHYDVQPPDPLDKWFSPPFEPQVRDGRLYARGISDDKGPMLIPIKVAQAFLETAGALPVNVKFLIEGEEEIGSPSLENFVTENASLLAADFALSADGAMWRIDVPSVTVASRGLVGLEFTITGARKDLHSGRFGGAVANPLHAMAQLVASLHTPDGRVTVQGFYDNVQELDAEGRLALTQLPFDEHDFLKQIEAHELFGEPGYSTFERQWTRPTLEVNGLWGGYQGHGSKTVIPSEAHAKITCRLVANQNPQDIQDRLVQHLTQHLPHGVQLDIHRDTHMALPYEIPGDHIGLKIAAEVLSEIYGQPPVRVRMGGTLPVSELFKRLLGVDTVFFSFSTADEDFHAPNEFFRLQRLYDGLIAWALYWQKLSAF
jgi:acetylornithine deacetylase/succinyl-diaminopimelate desuccinylase-like protein